MFATVAVGAALGLAPCAKALPHGPVVPAPLVLSTDCGWFSLDTDGDVARLPADWYATHKRPWRPPYGLTYRRTRPGRYLVLRDGRVIWRSRGLYFNEAGTTAFGPKAFAFDSYGRRGVFLTDLRGPERLVLPGRARYPIGFSGGKLLVSGPGTITVLSRDGVVLRHLRFRRGGSFAFDESTETAYFVTPAGMLTAVHGSTVRPIRRMRDRGSISLLGRRMLTLTRPGHVAILRRDDGSVVASSNWRGGGLDAGVSVSDDGRLFAFRVVKEQPAMAAVYILRTGEHKARARLVLRHAFEPGCGYSVTLEWSGSSLLYRSDDGVVVAALVAADGSTKRLTSFLRALPRRSASGNVFWATDFLDSS